jgi:pimeloyl-ACP methyl ester carboxylesterase
MEALELSVGPYRYSAIADGPRDGELVLLVHGFPETSFEWRHQVATLSGGYRAVADSAGTRRAGRAISTSTASGTSSRRRGRRRSAPTSSTSSARWGGFVAWYAATHRALLTLTVVSTPRPVPFQEAMRHGTARWRFRGTQSFRAPGAEARSSPRRRRSCPTRLPWGRTEPEGYRRQRRQRSPAGLAVPRQRLRAPDGPIRHTDALRLVDRRRART